MTVVSSVLGIASLVGVGVYVASYEIAARRLRRRLFGHISRTVWIGVWIAVKANMRLPVLAGRRASIDPWLVTKLVHGTCACTVHAALGPVSRGAWSVWVDAGIAALVGAYWLAGLDRRLDLAPPLVMVARHGLNVYMGFAPLGAVWMVIDSVSCFVVEACHRLRVMDESVRLERRERARIAHRAFATHDEGNTIYLHHDQVDIYLQQDHGYGHRADLSFSLSVVGGADDRVLAGRRLTAHVSLWGQQRVVVDVALDSFWFHDDEDTAMCAPPSHADVVLGLRLLRSALSRSTAAYAELLSDAAGAALAREHEARARGARAQRLIRRAWTDAVTDPAHPACARRLRLEFECLVV